MNSPHPQMPRPQQSDAPASPSVPAAFVPPVVVAEMECRATHPNALPGLPASFVVARMKREPHPLRPSRPWCLLVLPDVMSLPAPLGLGTLAAPHGVDTKGRYSGVAGTEEEAREVLVEAAAAVLHWLGENTRLGDELLAGLRAATARGEQ